MRVFNITDVATPGLVRCGLVRADVRVAGGRVIRPGEGADVPGRFRAELMPLVAKGLVSLDAPPVGYAAAAPQSDRKSVV